MKLVLTNGPASESEPKRPRTAGGTTGLDFDLTDIPSGASRPTWKVSHIQSTTPVGEQQKIQGTGITISGVTPAGKISCSVEAVAFVGDQRVTTGSHIYWFAPFEEEAPEEETAFENHERRISKLESLMGI